MMFAASYPKRDQHSGCISQGHTVTSFKPTFFAIVYGIPTVAKLLLGLDVGMRAVDTPPEEDLFHPPAPKVLEGPEAFTSHPSFQNAHLYQIQRVSVCRISNARYFLLVEHSHAWFPRETRWLLAEHTYGDSAGLFSASSSARCSSADEARQARSRIFFAKSLQELERCRGIRAGSYEVLCKEDYSGRLEPPNIATLGHLLITVHQHRSISVERHARSHWFAQRIYDALQDRTYKIEGVDDMSMSTTETLCGIAPQDEKLTAISHLSLRS